MGRFFDFSSIQLKIIVFLAFLLLTVAVFRIIDGYSATEPESFRFVVDIGDGDSRYAPVFKVDLNLSPADSMELIPGIGPVLAQRIIAYRDSIGKFEQAEDVMNVYGIGYATFKKIEPFIEVKQW